MELYPYISVAAICSASIFAGAFIASYAKEELKDGMKYFRALKSVMIYLITLLCALYFFENQILAVIIAFALIAASLFLPNTPRGYVFILLAALGFAIVLKYGNNYMIPSLIFIFGMCEGTITYYLERNQLYYRLFTRAAIFFLFALALFFIPLV